MTNLITDVLVQGLAYGILAIGVTLTYKILDFADLTVDGSFPLGAVIAAVCLINQIPVAAAMALAFMGGACAGAITGIIHVKLKITGLLSGILVMTGLYSINLMVGGNKSNIPVFNQKTIFTMGNWIDLIPPSIQPMFTRFYPILVVLIIVMVLKWIIDWFLTTQLGYLIRITGDNPQLVIALGEDIGKTKIIALSLSNGVAALAGSVIMQLYRFYDISMGSGTVVSGLAAVVLGLTVFSWMKSMKITSIVILGSILYRLSIAIALALKLPPSNLKLMSALIFIGAIMINNGDLKGWLNKRIGEVKYVITQKHL